MRKLISCVFLTLVAAAPARAQVTVQTPWFCLRVGQPAPTRVLVQTPWVTVGVAPAGQAIRPIASPAAPAAATYEYMPGAPPPVPLPISFEAAPTRTAPTLNEFAASFAPKAGRYEVDIVHPFTGKPVKVSFTLPDGSPRRVKVQRRGLDFDYGSRQVSIRFLRDGEVRVRE